MACRLTGSRDRLGGLLVTVKVDGQSDVWPLDKQLMKLFEMVPNEGRMTFIVDCREISLYRHGNRAAEYVQQLRQLNEQFPHRVQTVLLMNVNWIVSGLIRLMDTQQ